MHSTTFVFFPFTGEATRAPFWRTSPPTIALGYTLAIEIQHQRGHRAIRAMPRFFGVAATALAAAFEAPWAPFWRTSPLVIALGYAQAIEFRCRRDWSLPNCRSPFPASVP